MRPSDERLRLIEDKLGIGSWQWDVATDQMSWSGGLHKLLGLDAASVRPSLPLYESLVHPQDRLPFAELEGLATDPRQRNRRFRIIRPDGGLKWLWSLAQTVFDRTGAVERVVAVVCDITEMEELRVRFDSNLGLMRTIARVLEVEFWRAGPDGQVVDVTDWRSEGTRIVTADTVAGWRGNLHPEDRDGLPEAWRKATASGTLYRQSPRVKMQDGEYRPIHVMGLPFDTAGSEPPLWGGVATMNPQILSLNPAAETPSTERLTSRLVRAARAYLGWSADELADKANVSVSTVRRIESDASKSSQSESLKLIQTAFEAAGLSFWRDHQGRACLSGP